MFKIIGIILLGVAIGWLFRTKISATIVSKTMTVIIWLLLLVLGLNVGANDNIISNLDTLGLKALIITMGGVLGSCIFAMFIQRLLFKKKEASNER